MQIQLNEKGFFRYKSLLPILNYTSSQSKTKQHASTLRQETDNILQNSRTIALDDPSNSTRPINKEAVASHLQLAALHSAPSEPPSHHTFRRSVHYTRPDGVQPREVVEGTQAAVADMLRESIGRIGVVAVVGRRTAVVGIDLAAAVAVAVVRSSSRCVARTL